MSIIVILFWFSALVVTYAYFGYGAVISALAALRPRPHHKAAVRPKVSLIIAAYNEEAVIREKILNSLNQTYPKETLEIVIASDGSTDATPDIALEHKCDGVICLYEPQRLGKAAAMKRAADLSHGEILVFSDANSMYTPDTIEKLVQNFADPQVGCVAGEKRVRDHEGAATAKEAGLYWRYESYLKRMDSKVNCVVGAAGEIFAVRRSLFEPAEADSIIEDFIISMRIAASGHRVVYEPEAISLEEPAASISDELERRTRISAGGFQSIVRLRGILSCPQRLLIFQYLSHRVLRWAVVPFFLPVLLLTNFSLANRPIYRALLALQLSLVGLGGIGWVFEAFGFPSPKAARVPFYFYMLNLAAVRGFLRYISGRQKATWKQTGRLAPRGEVRSRTLPSDIGGSASKGSEPEATPKPQIIDGGEYTWDYRQATT